MKIGPLEVCRMPAWGVLMLPFALMASSAAADTVLIDENFDDVIISGTTTATPDVSTLLPALPTGTQWYSSNGASADVNVRRGSDLLNVNSADGFDSFFDTSTSNRLLILGDQSGPLGTSTNSAAPTAPGNGTFAFAVPFVLPSGSTHITIQFDWAFAGRDLSGAESEFDSFLAGVAGEDFDIDSPISYPGDLLTQLSPTNAFGDHFHFDGNLAVTLALTDLPAADPLGIRYLVFSLAEANSPGALASELGNSALGIDNIRITAVPLPSSAFLLLTALLSFFFGRFGLRPGPRGLN